MLGRSAEFREFRSEVRGEFGLVRAEFRDVIREVRSEVRAEFGLVRDETAGLRTELKSDIAELRVEFSR